MNFDIGWILLGLPVTFALGWLASRLDLRQLRVENRTAPKAYFKGLNYLLNEQQDKAIDVFIEAVQSDPDTSELHFALGNLFRRRGDYERAVRVHEHLLSRGDLKLADRHRAQHALAQDFLKAGLLDRAEAALGKLDGTPFQDEAWLALLAIYERSRDWPHATRIALRLHQAGVGDFSNRQAHYLCEQALALQASADHDGAQRLLNQAVQTAPQAARPRIELARWLEGRGQAHEAWKALYDMAHKAPEALPLVADDLARIALQVGEAAATQALLQTDYAETRSIDVLEALTNRLGANSRTDPRERYIHHLEHSPSLVVAARWIAGEKLEHHQFHPLVQRALDHAVKPLTRYRCAACGFEARQHFWHCPGCQTWDSYPARRIEEL